MKNKQEIIINGGPISSKDVWLALSKEIGTACEANHIYHLRGRPLKAKNVEKYLDARPQLKSFELEDEHFRLSFGYVAHCFAYFIYITPKQIVETSDFINSAKGLGNFVSSRLFDSDYSMFQNTSDVEWFRLFNKPYDHLPLSDRHGRLEIDCFKTRGREINRKCYIEAVGSTMWLGGKFFELTGANKEAVKATDWLEVTEHSPGVLKIVAQDKPFTSDQGKEGELQDKLRDLLFPGHN